MTSPADATRGAVQSVTKDRAKQRKAEERDRNAALNRRVRLVRSHYTTLREAAFEIMEEAYIEASDHRTLPVKPRQIVYRARPFILARTGEDSLNGQYFSQTLLIDYMEMYDCSTWDLIWDAGSSDRTPYRCRNPARDIGGQAIRWRVPVFQCWAHHWAVPDCGPGNRYRNILYIEKEGFHPIFQAERLQERVDIALMSKKGCP
jgi:hypothetical protein